MAGYKSIKDPGRTNRMGGLQQRILVAPFGDFDAIQKPADGTYKITTAHTFKVGKGWIELYVTKNTGKVRYEPMGGPDRNSFKASGQFYHPGESDDIETFANLAKNDRFIVLAPLPGTGELIQIGNDEFQVQIKPTYDTTENEGEGRGWLFDFECYCADKIKYGGTVTMLPTT